MIFKICYRDEIHKIFSPPPTFHCLLAQITETFGENLPSEFSIQYRDEDGDFITVSSDLEYQSMKAFDLSESRFSFKIFVVPTRQSHREGHSQFTQTKKSAEGSFEIIQDQPQNISGVSGEGILELNLSGEEEIVHRKYSDSPQNIQILKSQNSLDLNPEVPEYHDFESSVNSHNTTINMIESRTLALRHQKHRAHDLEDDHESADEQDAHNRSLERILTSIETRRLRRQAQAQECSYESSPRQRYEEDHMQIELASIRLRNIERNVRRLLSSSIHEDVDSDDEVPVRRGFSESLVEEKRILERHNAAFIIQSGWRNFKINQLIRRILQIESANLEHEYEQEMLERQRIQEERMQRRAFIPLSDESSVMENREELEEEENVRAGQNRILEKIDLQDCSDSFSFENDDIDEQGPQRVPNFMDLRNFPAPVREQNDVQSRPFDDIYIRAKLDSLPSISIQAEPLVEEREQRVEEVQEVRIPAAVYSYQLLPVKRANYVFLGSEDMRRTVFQTIYVINNGNKRWRKCLVKSLGPVSGDTLEVYNVEVGQLVLITLQLNGNFRVGNYVSQWKIVHENENGVVETVGETFEVEFTIMQNRELNKEIEREIRAVSSDDGRQGDDNESKDRKMEIESDSESSEEEEEEENESEEESSEENSQESYEEEEEQNEEQELNLASFGEIAKVKRLTTQFPCDPWDEIHDFVVERPNLTVEQLLNEYRVHRRLYQA